MRLLLPLLLLGLCSAACPRGQGVASMSPPGGDFELLGRLRCRAGALSHLDAHGQATPLEAPGAAGQVMQPLPYQLVSMGEPLIVSTIDEQLRPTCWAIPRNQALSPVAFPDSLPLYCRSRICALQLLPEDSLSLGGLLLLNSHGESTVSFPQAELLSPDTGSADETAYIAVPGSAASAFYPFGEKPHVIAFDAAAGRKIWEAELPGAFACADLRLVALTQQHALLLLQYDYELYDFFSVDQRGQVSPAGRLELQPAFTTSIPGGSFALSAVQADAEKVKVLLAGGRQWLSLDLAAGSQEFIPAAEDAPTLAEANPLPVGGDSVPGPGAAPLPLQLLPAVAGPDWEVPALRRADGAILVLGQGSALWLQPEVL